MLRITINGEPRELEVEGDVPLLWILRDELGLKGTKFGCGKGLCGACTVHLGGQPVRSCVLPVAAVQGQSVTTIEGLDPAEKTPLIDAWIAEAVPQCGYCQPGQIMAAAALLREKGASLEDADVREGMTNLCRCGTYNRIRRAILRARPEAATEEGAAPDETPSEGEMP